MVADRPRLGDVGSTGGNITEDRPLSPLLIPLQAEAVGGRRDDQIVDPIQGRELALKGIVSQRQGHRKKHRTADEILALIESKLLPAWGQCGVSNSGRQDLRYLLPTRALDVLQVEDHDDGRREPFGWGRENLKFYVLV
jgi:hypothetical protein